MKILLNVIASLLIGFLVSSWTIGYDLSDLSTVPWDNFWLYLSIWFWLIAVFVKLFMIINWIGVLAFILTIVFVFWLFISGWVDSFIRWCLGR